MSAREKVLRRIEEKKAEIAEMEAGIRDARVYVRALEDTLKLLPKEEEDAEASLRPGTAIDRARQAIAEAGKPLYIGDILVATGKPNDAPNRVALGGSISAYVRKGLIFTRTAPNTFGLAGMDSTERPVANPFTAYNERKNQLTPVAGPPPGFGGMEENLTDDDVI